MNAKNIVSFIYSDISDFFFNIDIAKINHFSRFFTTSSNRQNCRRVYFNHCLEFFVISKPRHNGNCCYKQERHYSSSNSNRFLLLWKPIKFFYYFFHRLSLVSNLNSFHNIPNAMIVALKRFERQKYVTDVITDFLVGIVILGTEL